MVTGDEWARALFRNGSLNELAKGISGSAEKIFTYLKNIEHDYKSLRFQFRRIMQKII
jgi:hypothetical protein